MGKSIKLEIVKVISHSRNKKKAEVTIRAEGSPKCFTRHLVRKGERWFLLGFPEKNSDIKKYLEKLGRPIPAHVRQAMEGFEIALTA